MTAKEAYLVLNMLPGVGPIRLRRLLQVYERPEAILRQKGSDLARFSGIGPKVAKIIEDWRKAVDLETELDLIDKAGVVVISFDDPEYPILLKEIHDPPVCLYVRGELGALLGDYPIAIVGSRRHSRYGRTIAETLTAAAVQAGWTIVSGLARGIDTTVHSTTVDAGGVTIAVLGGGLGHIYPQDNLPLARSICEKGALVSELPMKMKPDRRSFPMRNRIISGMSLGTVVVEAGTTSGTLITAQQALEQGRQVFAVPGRIDTPHSRGCHNLIKQGAKLVETLDDIHEEFSYLPLSGSIAADDSPGVTNEKKSPANDLSDLERELVRLLRDGEMFIDELQSQTKVSMSVLLSMLLRLELKRVVYQLPGKRFALHKGFSL